MPSRFGHYCGLCLFAGLILFTNLGGPKLWDRDEPRNAGCAAEMLARHDWVVPSFNGELRTHKPVLLYWLIMSSYCVWGVNEFAARLPSALLAIGTVLCTYEMGRRLFSARVGLWAGIVLASTLLFVLAGRAATPDSALIFCSTLAITLYVVATFRPRDSESSVATPPETRGVANLAKDRANVATHRPRSGDLGYQETRGVANLARDWANVATHCSTSGDLGYQEMPQVYFPSSIWAAMPMYGAMGLAVLAKGPVGLVLPTAVIGLFLLLVRRSTSSHGIPLWRQRLFAACGLFEPRYFLRTCWIMRPLTAIAVSLAVAAPWYLLVGVRTDGEFLRGFLLDHNLGRATQTLEGHRGNLFFYPLAILVGFFPWSVFTAPLAIDATVRLRRMDPWRVGYLLAISWTVVYVGVFSLAKTKLPSYITPCFPSMSLLAGAGIDRWLAGVSYAARGWRIAAYSVLAVVGMIVVIVIPIAAHQTLPGEEWLAVFGLVPLVGGILGIVALRSSNERRAVQGFALAAAAFVLLLFAWGAQRVSQHQQYSQLWAVLPAGDSSTRITAYGCLEPSWVFYGGRRIDEINNDATGPTPWIESHGRWAPKPRSELADVLSGPHRPFVITTEHFLEQVQQRLPSEYDVLASVPYFLKKDRLVLLGPANHLASRARETK